MPVILDAVDDMLDEIGTKKQEAFSFIYLLVDRSLQPIHEMVAQFLGISLRAFEKTTVGSTFLPQFHHYLLHLGTIRFWPPRSRQYIIRHSLSDYLLYTTAEKDDPFFASQ